MNDHQVFVTISQTGLCTPKGKVVATAGYKGRIVSCGDSVYESFVRILIGRTIDWASWSSKAAAKRDIEKAIALLGQLGKEVS